MVYPISRFMLFPIFGLFLKKIEGIENIPRQGPFIIASNYECYMDPSFIASAILPLRNKKIHYLSKKDRFWKLFGEDITRKWAGCVILDNPEQAFEELLGLLRAGEIIGIFIEGQRNFDKTLKRGKTGVVRLALEAQVPILPIGLIGTSEIAKGNSLMPKLKRARMKIGEPIILDGYYNKKIDGKLLRELTDDMMQVISVLTGKPYPY